MAKAYIVGIATGLFLGFSVSPAAFGTPEKLSLMATPPQPAWSELTVKQKIILAPLCDNWDSLEYYRQKKWLSIAARFSSLSPAEQRRIQGQMQEWNTLTPEQQRQARKNFKTTRQLSRDERQEFKRKWAEYVSLPESEKKRFLQGEPLERLKKSRSVPDASRTPEAQVPEATP
ncbi:MAG: DUF3106 domain-containing protein [Candidatus Accumulibacter sp.]|jgi:hypothetical protein|nr:DUF3106 domain-containing protein [Accumulibacter sp.]